MIETFWLALAAKMAMAATIVVATSLLVERSGPLVGALIATLPVSAGPAYVFIAMEHGVHFVAESALASLGGTLLTCCFIALLAVLAPRLPLWLSLPPCLAAWLTGAAFLAGHPLSYGTLAALNLSVIPALALATRRLTRNRSSPPLGARWWDIPMRAAAVMILVAIVLLLARELGPRAAGLAANAPVVMTSLAIVLHPRIGGHATAAVFASSLTPMIGFVLALMVVHKWASMIGAAAALSIGLAICMIWNLGLLALHHRLARR